MFAPRSTYSALLSLSKDHSSRLRIVDKQCLPNQQQNLTHPTKRSPFSSHTVKALQKPLSTPDKMRGLNALSLPDTFSHEKDASPPRPRGWHCFPFPPGLCFAAINARQQALFQHSPASVRPAPLLRCLGCRNLPLHPACQLLRPSRVLRRGPDPLSFYSWCPSWSRFSQQLLPPSIPWALLLF